MSGAIKSVGKAVGNALGIGGGHGGGVATVVQQVMAPPTTEDAQAMAEQRAKELRMRQGRASTILTGQNGDTSNIQTATKALLGS